MHSNVSKMKLHLKLLSCSGKSNFEVTPQDWEDDGNENVLVRNSHLVSPDNCFRVASGLKRITAILRQSIVFDSKLSFDEAKWTHCEVRSFL